MKGFVHLIAASTFALGAGCAQNTLPETFGVTMVEETTCIGQGGQIVVGPQGAFCASG